MSHKTSDVFRTSFLTMDGTFDPNNSQLFFRPLQAPLNTTDNSFYSLGAAQSNDPSLRINKYDSNGQLEGFGYLYDTEFNIPPPGKFIIVAGGLAPRTLVYSQDRVYWSTSPNGATFLTTSCLAVACDGFTWVAGGIGTRNVIYSSNGQNWLDISGASNILIGRCSAIATNGDLWIAGGRGSVNCAICFSYDLITWYNTSTNILAIFGQGTVACIAYNGSIWLAGGSHVTGVTTIPYPLAFSTDGIYWTELTVPLNECYSLCWNGSLWLAGGNYSGAARILYSIDGNDWIVATLNAAITSSVRAIAWNGTVLVAGGYDATASGKTLAYSYDGINWLPVTSTIFPSLCDGIMWDGITWQAVGQGGIATSSNGFTWKKNTQGSARLPQGRAIAVNKILPLVAPGAALPDPTVPLTLLGGLDNITGTTIAYSTDGITWKSSQQVASVFGNANVSALCWNGRLWVGGFNTGGYPGLYPTVGYSYDGIIWNRSTSGSAICTDNIISIAWGVDKFIALGDNGSASFLMDSSDGITWTNIATAPANLNDTYEEIQYNGTVWVLTNLNNLYYSYDGNTWISSTSGSTIFDRGSNSLVWNGRLWVVGGVNSVSGDIVGYSPDGINWLQGTLTYTSGLLYSMAWNGTLFICGSEGTGGTSLGYSYDGITWYPAEYIPITPTPIIRSVTWTGTLWVATGIDAGIGIALYSYNGTVWHNSSNGSLVVTDGGIVVAANRVNPYNGNTLPPPVLNQGITVPNGYGIFTSNANNLYKSSVLYLDETNGRIGINQTTRTYTDANGDPISAALEISGGGITVTTTSTIPGLYLISSNSAGSGSGGRIELNDTSNGFGWRFDNNANNFNHLEITAFVTGSPSLRVMDMRPDTGTIGIGGANDSTYRLKVYGDLNVTGTLTSTSKSFLIDHPDPTLSDTHYLRYCCVEGPTRGDNLYRWMLTTSNGSCVQALPSYSPYLNENWQFFVSAKESFGTGYVTVSEDETFFTLYASEDGIYSIVGVATRKDKGALSFDEKGVEYLKE